MRLIVLAALLCACGEPPRPAPAVRPPAAPRLVVLVVIDQLPLWAWPDKAAATEHGIARLRREGRVWRARYPFAATQTAPGHAALGTGAPPSVTGIIGNEWWDRAAGREIKAVEGGSADKLRVDGIGDALLAARPAAKAVAVALKERSALLTLGHAGRAVWYQDECACFVTSGDAPGWLAALAEEHPIAPRLGEPWRPLDEGRVARLSGLPDDMPGEIAIPGWDATFPHDLDEAAAGPAKAVINSPLGDAMVAEAAIAAVRGEGLGDDDVADLLIVGFGAHDYIGHSFGPESWEAWDTWLRLDRTIGALLEALDAEVGAGRWALVLTGDHGSPRLPERHERGERVSFGDIEATIERALGDEQAVVSARIPYVYLREGAEVRAVVAAMRTLPYLARVDAIADLDCAKDDDTRSICLSIDRERSGDVYYVPTYGTTIHKPGWIDGVAHGSTHDYDREVPILVVAPGLPPGDDPAWLSPLQVAPTLADLLGVAPPPAAHSPPVRVRRTISK